MNMEGIVVHIAKRYEATLLGMDSSLSREDLIQEGLLLATGMDKDWTEFDDEAHFVSSLCMRLRSLYVDWIRRASRKKRKRVELPEETYNPTTLMDKYLDLPRELQAVVRNIVEAPEEFMAMIRSMPLRPALRSVLRKMGMKDVVASSALVTAYEARKACGWVH